MPPNFTCWDRGLNIEAFGSFSAVLSPRPLFAGSFPRLWARSSPGLHQFPPHHPQVGQREQREQLRRVLLQSTLAGLHICVFSRPIELRDAGRSILLVHQQHSWKRRHGSTRQRCAVFDMSGSIGQRDRLISGICRRRSPIRKPRISQWRNLDRTGLVNLLHLHPQLPLSQSLLLILHLQTQAMFPCGDLGVIQ